MPPMFPTRNSQDQTIKLIAESQTVSQEHAESQPNQELAPLNDTK